MFLHMQTAYRKSSDMLQMFFVKYAVWCCVLYQLHTRKS
jgi:heme/copper-type cytochrome/quinol oxidase subunit 4